MYDLWVEKIKTKEAWRLDHDNTKEVYLDEDDKTIYKGNIWEYKFYPICPKDAPTMELPNRDYEQLNIFDYL